MRHMGVRFDRSVFGMRLQDAEALAKCLRRTSTLQRVALPGNAINDHLALVLVAGLVDNKTITRLDLSQNSIGAGGAAQLARLLGAASVIVDLSLADNSIDVAGARHLAAALASNTSLQCLNLRLNGALGDEGAAAIIDALASGHRLTSLNLSHCR